MTAFVSGIRMNILQNNPYRILGVYSNSPTKERLANHNRMKAFLKVGKSVFFPLDLPQYLSAINRTEASVADAESKLTLPKDQILYAQFWFIKTTPLDEVAFNHLFAGEIDKAEEIWQKRECASSLQNLLVCALMHNDYAMAISYAETLYGSAQYATQLISAVVGGSANIDIISLSHDFLDVLIEEVGCPIIIRYLNISEWKSYVSKKAVSPIIKQLEEAVAKAMSTRKNGPIARWNAGNKLMATAKQLLPQLRKLLPKSDLQYQMIADKLGLEILQCGIDYFNDSEEPDAAHKAMSLQKYAKSIVVGQMAKDRCKENVDILQRIIDNLPPAEVFDEDKAIKEELKKFCNLPDKICHSVALLNNTKPYLQSIKAKLGANNIFYLKLSTSIVGNALHNVIEEVNALQNDPTFKLNMIIDKAQALDSLKSVLRSAWNATTIIDTFDMEADFKGNRYLENRRTLSNMCNQVGVSTRVSSPRPSPTTSRRPTSPSSQQTVTTNSNDSDKMPGWVAYWIGVLVIGIIGAFVNGGEGFFVGCILGLFTGGPFAKLILSDD